MRRALLSPSAVVEILVSSKHSIIGQLHVDYLHSNQWVWKLIELATDRSLDIVKAAVSIHNTTAFQQYQQQHTDMDLEGESTTKTNVSIIIPENIVEAVDAASETARELYTHLTTKLLWSLHDRHQLFVSTGQENPRTPNLGILTSLDPRLVSLVSLLTRTIRIFHLTEKGLQLGAFQGTTVPSIASRLEVSKKLLSLSKIDPTNLTEDEVYNQILGYITGPAKRIWEECVV